MTIVNWKRALFSLKGRLSITQFWKYSVLNSLLILAVISGLPLVIGKQIAQPFIPIVYLYALWVSVAIIVKRLHDQNKSGIRYLFYLIPVAGYVWCVIECGCMGGGIEAVNPNQFGPPPEVPVANWPQSWKEQWKKFL